MNKPRPAKRLTLADVAREAGVSVQTASHVLAGNMSVRLPETTRSRVREAAARIGYRPNRLAQAMKSGRSGVVGVWMPIDRAVPNHLRMLHLISEHARASGYEVMITGLSALEALTSGGPPPHLWPVDAIIAIDAEKAVESLRLSGADGSTPVVVLGFQQFDNSDSVAWDLAGAAREATERMIRRGAQRIVFLTLDWVFENFPREQRRRGYQEAMESAGLEAKILSTPRESSSSAEETLQAYLSDNPRPDAVFGFSDRLAIGAARALMDRGVRIPEDCLVWGAGDYPESEDFRVPISTIRTPVPEVIEIAWKCALERLSGTESKSRLTVLPMELVERESSRR